MEESAKTKESPRKRRKGLTVFLCVVLVLALLAAVLVFVVYSGRYLFLTAELGDGAPEASAFMKNGGDAEYAAEPEVSLTEEGVYILSVKSGGTVRPELLIVRDTMAPETDTTETSITVDDAYLDPEEALGEVRDASDFTAEWISEPEYGAAGTYECEIKLADSCGNERTVPIAVKVLGLVDVLEYEAGGVHPTLADFMAVERDSAELITDMNTITWDVPGDYEIQARFDGKTYTSTLRVVDTTAPEPDAVPAAVLKDGDIDASAFTLSGGDATAVSYEYVTEPETSQTGTVECSVRAVDLGGNETVFTARAVVCDAELSFEASMDYVTESDVLSALGEEYSDYEMTSAEFIRTELGAHAVTISNGEDSAVIGVTIVDTTAPAAESVNYQCSTGYYSEPDCFVTNITDMSSVTVEYINEPDWNAEGEQEVSVVLRDRAGNETVISAVATVAPDTTAPVIYAARDRNCYVDEAVSYFKEVFAEDNADPNPELTVDKSKVDYHTAGTYEVTYTATDAEGNSSSATVSFTFIEKKISDEELNAAVQGVLDEILTDGMSVPEQAYAIFDWCYSNIIYIGTSDKTDWKSEAYRGITEGVGDCFTFYSTSYALLQNIDCQVLSVERMNGRTQHFWCLVNLGTGWYHFDTCNVGPNNIRCFMKTSEELLNYSVQYWRFDTTLYPEVETTPYEMDLDYEAPA